MSVHTGTHIDAPLHFINGGHDVIGFSLHTFIGRVKIFEIKNNSEISLNEVQDLPINSNDRVFFKTKNSDVDWINQPFNRNYIHLSLDAAKYLSDRNIIAIGIDYLSIGGLTDGAEVHLALLRKNILIIEGLQLREIIPGEYDMICLPIKIKNSDGSPARVIIRKA
jgi:arylformamidase